MHIILSPSKGQMRKDVVELKKTPLIFPEKTYHLVDKMKLYSKNELANALSVKNKLLDAAFSNYKNFYELNSVAGINLYNGMVFKQLTVEDYSLDSIEYLSNHVYILSALYGIVSPSTSVKPYRMDMKSTIQSISLYDFWKEPINEYFNSSDLIVNLASNEFSKLINRKMLTIHFKEYNNGKLRTVAARAKKARGKFLNEMIINNIINKNQLKSIVVMEYTFNEELSDLNNFIFTK